MERSGRVTKRLVVFAGFVFMTVTITAIGVSAQTTTPTPTPTEPSGSAPTTVLFGPNSWRGFALVAGLILLFVLVWLIPYLRDIRMAYTARAAQTDQLVKSLITAARQDGLSIDELRELSTMVQEPPSGVIGLTRALIALTVLTGVGMALVLTLISNAADAIDLRKTIVTSLLSILATIAGFYFGSRTSQDATNAATAASSPPPPPSNGGNGTTTGRTTTTGTTTDKGTTTDTGTTGGTDVDWGLT